MYKSVDTPQSSFLDFNQPSKSVEGYLVYNTGRRFHITFSSKHIDSEKNTAKAWQFTANDSVQFNQLKLDEVHTYVEETIAGEKMVCTLDKEDNIYSLTVIEVMNEPETKATKKLKFLLYHGIHEAFLKTAQNGT